jgi:spore germination protein YaaH
VLLAASALVAAEPPEVKSAPGRANPRLLRERRRILGARPLAMYYSTEDTSGLAAVEKNAALITLLGPQCFRVDSDGIVRGAVPAALAELAQRLELPVMPLLVNPGFDRSIASSLLRDPRKQERAASYLAYLANRENFSGWQLDLEYIDPADKARYSAFVRRVAAKLHRDGRLLSLAVTPRFSDQYPDTRDAEFRTGEWGAPFDLRALGRAVDFIVLMTYDHHGTTTPPGPVAGYEWARAAIEYAARRVPPQKLVMGIPFYSREWVETAHGMLSRSLNFSSLQALLGRPEVQIQWDERWRAPWLQFREGTEVHTVWFDDRRSYQEKLELVRRYRLRGFAAWRLGTEDPEFWDVASEYSKSLEKSAPSKAPRRAPRGRSRAAPSRGR